MAVDPVTLSGPPGWVVAAFEYAVGRPDRNSTTQAQVRAANEAGYTAEAGYTRQQQIAVGQGIISRDEFALGQGGGPGSPDRGARAGPPPVAAAPPPPAAAPPPPAAAPPAEYFDEPYERELRPPAARRTPPISAVVPATPAFPTSPVIPGTPGFPGSGPSIADRFPGYVGLPGVGSIISRVLAPFIVGGLFWPTAAGRGSDLRDFYAVPVAKPRTRRRGRRRTRVRARPVAIPRPVVRPSSGPVTISRPRAAVLNPPLAVPSRFPSPFPVPPPPPATNVRVGDAPMPGVLRAPMVISGSTPQSLPAPSTVPVPAARVPLQVPAWLPLLASFIGPAVFPLRAARANALTYGIPGISSPGLSVPGTGVGPAQLPLTNPFPGATPSPVPALNPLTALQPAAVPFAQAVPQTQTDRCNCAKTKQRKKKSKPRSVCYAGTFIERSKGLSKTRKRKVKCK